VVEQQAGRARAATRATGRGRRSWIALVAAVLLPGAAAAPPPPAAREVDDERLSRLLALHHTEQEQVRLVLLPATVLGGKGRPIRDLEAAEFRLFEDHVPQEIRVFNAAEREPVSIAFLLDLSGSMRQPGRLDEAKAAIRFFAASVTAEDRLALIGFADRQVDWITDFTADRERFLARLDVQEGFGQTALYDAVAAAPRLVDDRTRGRKAIVLITDGVDNASHMDTFRALRLAREVSVPIYAIGFTSRPSELRAKGSMQTVLRVLELFSAETGGAMFAVHEPAELALAVRRIAEELRYQYLIGYYPSRRLWDGTYREVRLETTRRGLDVRTRRGYYAHP
jgi:Ca-activated chloride channel family protein